MTLGLLHDPWREEGAETGTGVLARYRRGLRHKANPRSEAYLRELFAERYPDGRLVRWTPGLDESLGRTSRVVLVYPDATGLGWAPIERHVRRRGGGTEIRALNGRRRDFALDGPTRRALRLRRGLERTMLLEMVAAPLVVLLGALLAGWDRLRGRT